MSNQIQSRGGLEVVMASNPQAVVLQNQARHHGKLIPELIAIKQKASMETIDNATITLVKVRKIPEELFSSHQSPQKVL